MAAALFGAAAPAASVLAGDVAPVALAGLLYLGAALAVAPAVIRRPWPGGPLRRSWWPVAVAVVSGGALGPALLMLGLARTEPASASILLNLELVFTVLLAATVFREHIGIRVLAGASLVALGGVVLAWQPGAELSVGALLIAAACACWGVDNCVTAGTDQISPEHVVLLKGLVAGSVNLALGIAFAGGPAGAGLSPAGIGAALVIGALGYGVSITQWVMGAHLLGAARGQVIFASAPFLGAALAWLVLGEPVTARQVIAGALALAGVALSLETAHSHVHRHVRQVHDHEHSHDDQHHDHHGDGAAGRHSHVHEHRELAHAHAHVPDLHHRHRH